jgi:hypothetical protein
VKPGEEIRLVKENLAFSVSLWKGATAGRVPARPLVRPSNDSPLFNQFNQQDGNIPRSEAELAAELIRGAANQMRAAFALSALQAQRSLAVAFPGEPSQEEWPELRAALSAMYLIGRAVERSIVQPIWECPPQYRRLYHIRRLSFTLNATALEGRVLSWDDFGGLERYIALLDYCARSADAAVASGSGSRSRTLSPNLGSSRTAFGGVIGSPQAPPEDGDNSPAVSAPRGFPGDPPERRLAPDAPPLLPPRVQYPVQYPQDEDTDSWDSAIRERADQWHSGQASKGATQVPYRNGGAGNDNGGLAEAFPVGGLIRRFIAERCATGEERRTLAGELYAGFQDWCRDLGQQPVSQRAFGMRLTSLGLRRKRRGHGKHWWEGICLTE